MASIRKICLMSKSHQRQHIEELGSGEAKSKEGLEVHEDVLLCKER